MASSKIEKDKHKLTEFRVRRGIRKLALFGSVLREDFCDQSDVFVLGVLLLQTQFDAAGVLAGRSQRCHWFGPVMPLSQGGRRRRFRDLSCATLRESFATPGQSGHGFPQRELIT
jgi:hypothetical protein